MDNEPVYHKSLVDYDHATNQFIIDGQRIGQNETLDLKLTPEFLRDFRAMYDKLAQPTTEVKREYTGLKFRVIDKMGNDLLEKYRKIAEDEGKLL